MSASDWEDILDKGEEILWQGRPDAAVHLRPSSIPTFVFGLFFAGFAVFWMVMAASSGGNFWMFGLIHFFVGLAVALSPFLWGPYKRRKTWYTLTNRRAIIATDLPLKGKQLRSFPITDDTVIDFSPGPLATISFATETRRGSKGRHYQVPIGFELIRDGGEVFKMMRDIQTRDRQIRDSQGG